MGSGGSFGGNPLRQFFGLGKAERIVRLAVYWPMSAKEQVFEAVPMDTVIRVTEQERQFEPLHLVSFEFDIEHSKETKHKNLH